MKKILFIVLAIVAHSSFGLIWEDPETRISWQYKVVEGGVELCGSDSTDSPSSAIRGIPMYCRTVIPSSVNGMPVVSLGINALYGERYTGHYLEDAVIPEGVTYIGTNAFANCTMLKRVVMPDSVVSVDYGAFYGCHNLTNVVLSKNLKTIGSSAFYNCKALVSPFEMPDVVEIGESAFEGCGKVPVVTLGKIENVGARAFAQCWAVEVLNIPNTIVSIGDRAFSSMSKLRKVVFENHGIDEEQRVPNFLRIGNSAFSSCFELSEIVLPDRSYSLGEFAFSSCEKLVSIDNLFFADSFGDFVFSSCKSLTSIELPKHIRNIGNGWFSSCISLRVFNLPSDLECIGMLAFDGCEKLESIDIPSTCKDIGGAAFEGCSSLTNFTLPPKMKAVPYALLDGCSCLSSVQIPMGVTNIEAMAFRGCLSLAEVRVPWGVKGIDELAFSGCVSLREISLPETLTTIGDRAFMKCTSLTAVSFPWSMRKIGQYAFEDCTALQEVNIPVEIDGAYEEGITYLFKGCSNISRVTIPGKYRLSSIFPDSYKYSITEVNVADIYGSEICDKAYQMCNQLVSVKIPSSVRKIGVNAFDCTKLMDISVDPRNVTYSSPNGMLCSKDGRTLYLCPHGRVDAVIPEGVVSIESGAFAGGTWLGYMYVRSVTIPDSIEQILQSTFAECPYLETLCASYENMDRILALVAESGFDVSKLTTQYTYPPAPVIIPADGTVFETAAKVTITNAMEEAVVHYTVDGSDPSTNSPVFKKFTIASKTTIKAVAEYRGYVSKMTVSTVGRGKCELPRISSSQIPFHFSSNEIRIQCDTENVEIHYTLDGSDPNEASPLYGGPFTVDDTTVVKTIATGHADFVNSDVATETFTREWIKVPTPTFSGNSKIYHTNEKVEISCSLEGASIYYRSVDTYGSYKLYTEPFSIRDSGYVYAYAAKDDYLNSDIASTHFTREWEPVATPVISLSNGGTTFQFSGAEVVITCATEGAEILYTTDGRHPSYGKVYNGPFVINDTTTVRALASKEDYGAVEKAVTLRRNWVKTTSPKAVGMSGGNVFHYPGEVITLGCDMEGTTIYYTLDGSTPTKNSTRYDGPFTIDDTTTIKMISVKDDYSDSDVTTVTFTREWFTVDAPQVETIYGSLEDGDETDVLIGSFLWVKMNCPTEGAAIHYTMDGSVPTVTSPVYEEPFKVSDSVVIKAIAVKDDWRDSSVASATVTKKWTDGDSLNSPDMTFSGDGTAAWTTDTEVSHDGVASMKSGEIGNDQTSIIQTVVNGSGKVIFWWKASCEQTDLPPYWWDYGSFMIGSEEVAWIDGITDWRRCEVRVEGAGDHVLKWKYEKDSSDREGGDCIWLDQITWIPDAGNATTKKGAIEVPYKWLDAYGLLAEYDPELVVFRETGKTDGAGKALTVMDEFVAGTNPNDPASKFSVKIEVVDGKPVVTWDPALNGDGIKTGIRSYTIQGSNDLKEWSAVPDGKESEYHYFKAKVGMP